ncbi:hypothetical protein KAU25_04795, partial [Candidatus Bathyarchaeota archaeon]|nr:hypothetical protein [Candidatus Bathyarchaeota archaeon]
MGVVNEVKLKVLSGILLVLLLANIPILGFNIEPVKTESTITHNIEVTYSFSKPKIEKAEDPYSSVSIDGLPQLGRVALPVLPFETARILLPSEAVFKHVRAIGGEKTPLSGSYLVECGQEPVPLTDAELTDRQAVNPDEIVYGSLKPYPGELFADVSIQRKMGYQILLLNLHPVEYVPGTGKLSYYESITLEVEVTSKSGSETSAYTGHLQQRKIVESMVDNPEAMESYSLSEQTPTYQYVIITNEELNSTSEPFNFQALRDN